jgi:hypothetical protein
MPADGYSPGPSLSLPTDSHSPNSTGQLRNERLRARSAGVWPCLAR